MGGEIEDHLKRKTMLQRRRMSLMLKDDSLINTVVNFQENIRNALYIMFHDVFFSERL